MSVVKASTGVVEVPELLALSGAIGGNRIAQVLRPAEEAANGQDPNNPKRRVAVRQAGELISIVRARPKALPTEETILVSGDHVRWITPEATPAASETLAQGMRRCSEVRASWARAFKFRAESDTDRGLRTPQVGALHAALAHWTVNDKPATIVLPTGTGKTETMLALLVCQQIERLLVIVPTSPLREQTARKFLTLGLLRSLGVISPSARLPVVGTLEHRLPDVAAVEEYFQRCNVVVTTMAVLAGCSAEVREAVAASVSHLFIDEAHHISAPTWSDFRSHFVGKRPILQFTATPFRNDGKAVDGKPIYTYPLRNAQEGGYFKPIAFRAVREYSRLRADEAIARTALEQLRADRGKGLRHLVMARADSIPRAKEIHAVYQALGAEHVPLMIHSKMTAKGRREALASLRSGTSQVIVCVDMLGEGFDLPGLKIVAIHDTHKSLAITLQFTGRFVRPAPSDIGDATVIANIADPGVEESLEALYAEDADWNYLLRGYSEGATGRQVRRAEFVAGFSDPPDNISLQNIFPKMSMVIYRAPSAKWTPMAALDVVDASRIVAGPTVHRKENVGLFITREEAPVPWGDIRDLRNVEWDLYLYYFDSARRLLFINSSNNGSLHGELAKALVGDAAVLVNGEQVFRVLHGVSRMMLINLGLKHHLSKMVNFTMYAGSDIKYALTQVQAANKTKSNLFGRGFQNGERVSVGCSYKGRIWSHLIAESIPEWMEWASSMATKLLDGSISTTSVLDGVLYPEEVADRPALVPVGVEWPEWLLHQPEQAVYVTLAGAKVPMFETSISLSSQSTSGPLRLCVSHTSGAVEIELRFGGVTPEYVVLGGATAEITVGRKPLGLVEFFGENAPTFRFEDGSTLQDNRLVRLRATQPAFFDASKIEAWDWTGTDLGKESQTISKDRESIQRRVIERLMGADQVPPYDIVFDDDDKGEAADIIAMRVDGEDVVVDLFHCKYSSKDDAGARLDDLYVVCGQAQGSVYRRGQIENLFSHMLHRDAARLARHSVSRFERGDPESLERLRRQSRLLRPNVTITIVQPGLSRMKLEERHLTLLGVTEAFLKETYEVPLRVVGSA